MTIIVNCRCGAQSKLEDQYSGKKVECKQCNTIIEVPPIKSQSDPIFNHDKFFLKQGIAISKKYDVLDEEGHSILFIESSYVIHDFLISLTPIIVLILAFFLLPFIMYLVKDDERLGYFVLGFFFIGISVGLVTVFVWLDKKLSSHINIYRNRSKTKLLLSLRRDNRFELINTRYILQDDKGKILARFHYDITNKHWYCYAHNGALLATAEKESTHYIISGGNGEVIGEFNKGFIPFVDESVLDMTADETRKLNRRFAIVLAGFILTTRERSKSD